ncbi:MAG TPA: MFS transporter [Ramlibacter sp.]|nr:MFS transporter [Ramlibacter sp.]
MNPSASAITTGPILRSAWPMLLALIAGFAMSQAFRTVPAIVAGPLQQDFALTPQQLGAFAGMFHLAFGGLQLLMGMGIDVWGPRRTVLAVSPLAVAGALLATFAPGYQTLLLAQALIGVGCAPAFVVCTVFIARRFAPERFAAVSGATLGLGSVGMLLTGTPLAWLIQHASWRAGFLALAGGAALAWLAIALVVRDAPQQPAQDATSAQGAQRPGMLQALAGYGALFRLPHTWGIVTLGAVTYASYMALRGLWLGPLLLERHGFSLVGSGNVVLAASALSIVAPPLLGRLDPGDLRRRRWIIAGTLGMAALFAAMALTRSVAVDVGATLAISLATAVIVLQYTDVKAAYPAHMTGRAMAVFTMAMFLGVALAQWLTGVAASVAQLAGLEVYASVLGAIALLLVAAAAAFRCLPAPPATSAPVRR